MAVSTGVYNQQIVQNTRGKNRCQYTGSLWEEPLPMKRLPLARIVAKI